MLKNIKRKMKDAIAKTKWLAGASFYCFSLPCSLMVTNLFSDKFVIKLNRAWFSLLFRLSTSLGLKYMCLKPFLNKLLQNQTSPQSQPVTSQWLWLNR